MSVITLPASVLAIASFARFEFVRAQDALTMNTGAIQITAYPDERWFAQLQIPQLRGADLRAWALALDLLSDLSNVVAISPPYYERPSTGYAGSSPLINGGSQLGVTLAIDTLTNSRPIQTAGDFLSFDTTSAGGNTNRQLIKVKTSYSSNGSGQASVSLVSSIRQAPANNASVNIQTPSAFFKLLTPRSTVDLALGKRSPFTLDLEERIFL